MRLPGRLIAGGCLIAGLAIAAEPGPAVQPWADSDAGWELPKQALLEIGLIALDPGLPAAADEAKSALRQAESRYIPYLLRTVLERSRRWGPVRMLPGPDLTTELLVSGAIIESEPDSLVVRFVAEDATGRQWLNRVYRDTAGPEDYAGDGRADPFLDLYRRVADDLAAYRATLSLAALDRTIQVARMRYAETLAPGTFDGYLVRKPDGRLQVNRLPSEEDPMMARVERIRDSEYLFVDTVDQHFGNYFREIAPTYLALREAIMEADRLMASYRRGANSGDESLQQRYNQLRELKLYQLTLRERLGSFAFEVGPTTIDLKGEVVNLSGTLTDQYAEWRDLLRAIYRSEVGLSD